MDRWSINRGVAWGGPSYTFPIRVMHNVHEGHKGPLWFGRKWNLFLSHGPSSLLTEIDRELPLVDREDELTLLKKMFDQAASGKGQVGFVAGEGGIGKTRLVHEFGQYAKHRGSIFAVGRSYEEEAIAPYSPWIEVIRSIVQTSPRIFLKSPGRTLAEVGKLVPELAAKSSDLGIKGWISGHETRGLSSATDAERVRLFQAVTDLLTYASRERPLTIFLDDVLWADAASLHLLHYLCRRVSEQKLMVIATYRDAELSEEHPLSRLLLDLNRERILKKIALSRLTGEQVAQILSNQLGGGPVASEFSKLIYSRTGGNPFFVEEVLRSLLEENRVHQSQQGWTVKEIEQVEIPSTIRALIKQRLYRLGSDEVQVLSFAATIGMDFDYELLRKVAGQDEEQLINHLEKAVRAGLVKERRSTKQVSYIFVDEQIREFLYGEQSIVRKRKIHARVARAMEELHQNEKNRHLEELANHYVQAGETAKAAEFSLMAGDRATALHAHPDARRHFANAYELLSEDQQNERLEVLIKIGDASYRMGEREESVRNYKEAVSIARTLNQKRRIAQLYSRLGYAHWWLGNDKQAALENYMEGLKVLADEKDTPEEAAICQNIARMLVITGEISSGLEWCEKAIPMARKLSDYEVLAQALQTLARGLRPDKKNNPDIFLRIEESLKISMDHGLEDPACRAHVNLGITYRLLLNDYGRAKEVFLRGIEYARRMGHINYEALLEAVLALHAYVPLGEWEKALEVAKHSLQIGSEGEIELYRAYSPIPIGVVTLFRGNVEGAEDYLSRAYPFAERTHWPEIIYFCCWALGRLYIEKSDLNKAEEHLLRAIDPSVEWGWTSPHVEVYFELVRLYSGKEDLGKAGEFYERLRHEAERIDEKSGYPYERWAYGLLASAKEDWNEARNALKSSRDLWSELKNPYHYAQTTSELGRVLLENREEDEGRRLVEEAQRVFSHLGASLDLARLENFRVDS